MTPTDHTFSTQHALRLCAEEVARNTEESTLERGEDLLPNAMHKLIHELRVHQIELEMQNDELRRTQAERDMAEARYFDFYDLAPVGYITVSTQGLVLRCNLTAAAMLGVTRGQLAGQAFSRFIEREDQDTYYLLRKQLLETSASHSCELRMLKHDGHQFFARMDAIAARGNDGAPVLRLVLIDITASKTTCRASAACCNSLPAKSPRLQSKCTWLRGTSTAFPSSTACRVATRNPGSACAS
jgi:PAS domain S-box-containing protein